MLQNIQEAIENGDKVVEENGGIMKLPVISSRKNQEEHVREEKSGIEKEFEEITASRKRRRKMEAGSDDEDGPEVTNPPHEAPEARNSLETLTQSIESKQTKNVAPEKPAKKVQKIDLNAVLNKDVGGLSNAQIVETEDADGTTTTIQEAFADDDVIR